MGMFSHFLSFTSLCAYDFKAGFAPSLLVILFTTEGKGNTEEEIKVIAFYQYKLFFSVKRAAPRCTLWFKMVLYAGLYVASVSDFIHHRG